MTLLEMLEEIWWNRYESKFGFHVFGFNCQNSVQVKLVDEFVHPKTKRASHCYRITYRHMERTLTKTEANDVHKQIESQAVAKLGVIIR